MNTYDITLKQKIDSPNNMLTYLIFEVEGDFSFKEWQFVMLETEIDGKPFKRAYSLADTLDEYQKTKTVKFYVKKVNKWWMSDFLTQKIRVWDKMKMSQSFWHMTDEWDLKDYLFICIWTWIAAMRWLFKKAYSRWDAWRMYFLCGERYFDNLIKEYNKDFQIDDENIKIHFWISKEDISEEWIKDGNIQINKWHVQDWLAQAINFFDDKNIKVFACGKPDMIDEIVAILENGWIPKENIKAEKY